MQGCSSPTVGHTYLPFKQCLFGCEVCTRVLDGTILHNCTLCIASSRKDKRVRMNMQACQHAYVWMLCVDVENGLCQQIGHTRGKRNRDKQNCARKRVIRCRHQYVTVTYNDAVQISSTLYLSQSSSSPPRSSAPDSCLSLACHSSSSSSGAAAAVSSVWS